MRLYCATTNAGKLREFQLALAGALQLEVVPGLRSIPPPEETGATFEENAAQKALYYARFCDGPIFADDSGLEVDALGGAPGVYSARFAGPEASDEANNRLLLEKLQGVTQRSARFVCVVALARPGEVPCPGEVPWMFRGVVDGRILDAPRGKNGFGYDPLFYYPPFHCAFGEAPLENKMRVSHRGQALGRMLAFLKNACPPS
jgi:XTP/dITP diphosphohydrolase